MDLPGFQGGVRAAEIFGGNAAVVFIRGTTQRAVVDQVGDGFQGAVLRGDGLGLQNGAGEHELGVQRGAFAHQHGNVEWRTLFDDADSAFRGKQVGDIVPMFVPVGGAENKVGRLEAEVQKLLGHVLMVVDDMMGAERFAPFDGLRA